VDIEVVILQDGSMAFFTRSGNFEQGSTVIQQLVSALHQQGIEFDSVSQPEQHAHSPDATVWSFEVAHEH